MSEKKFFFGIRKQDKAHIYLTAPTWDCGWYWSFGYLGNSREHYHLSSYQIKTRLLYKKDGSCVVVTEQRNICMRDALLEDYDLNPKLLKGSSEFSNNLWTFCELALTAYALKETAEILKRGGSHMAENPCADLIKNFDEFKRINEIVLPAIFAEIEKIFC